MSNIFAKTKKTFYHLPPTAVPIRVDDVKSAIRAMINPRSSYTDFVYELRNMIGTQNCVLTSSGRAALFLILLTLKQRSDRRQVIVPAYTCSTVVQAVIEAGLQPLFCDVDPHTLSFDRDYLNSLLTEKVLSIIPTHLYGLVQDVTDLIGLCKDLNIYIVEDAAQAFGALVSGQSVGRGGDFGFFSLGFGKCIPTGGGGIICTKDAFISDLDKTIANTKSDHIKWGVCSLGEYLAYGLATTPAGWWIVYHSFWNPAKQEIQFNSLQAIKCEGINAVQAGVGKSILNRIHQINSIKRSNAKSLKKILANVKFIDVPEIGINTDPVYLRFPVIIDNKIRANELYHQLSKAGIGVSRSYTYTLPDLFGNTSFIKETQFSGAQRLSECLLTLPTHPYVKAEDLSVIQRIFESHGSLR